MSEGIEYDGGPQPVAYDLSQYVRHLIDAARLEGIRLGLEAAWHQISGHGFEQDMHMGLDPETIAREAVLDKLASEAQEQGMGYE